VIDPQLQAIAWIKERESKRGLQVVRLGQKKMLNTVEQCMENGLPVLIENIAETIDAVLTPVLSRATIRKGRQQYIKLGDKEVAFNPSFRLFVHTKLSNPHYPPEIQAETTIINFTVTEDGLEEQLLALVVKKERPDLEAQKSNLIRQQNSFKIRLSELEDSILFKLANAQGDVLEDVELIENLEDSKRISNEIAEKVKVALDTEQKINRTRESYRGCALRGAVLFFIMNDLFKVNSFYFYSLNSFVIVFERSIDMAGTGAGAAQSWNVSKLIEETNPFKKFKKRAKELAAQFAAVSQLDVNKSADEIQSEISARLMELTDSITFSIFSYVRRGMFEEHKLMLASQFGLKILIKDKLLPVEELGFLLQPKTLNAAPTMSVEVRVTISLQEFGAMSGASFPGLQLLGTIDGVISGSRRISDGV
jgi:dynein heavy chain